MGQFITVIVKPTLDCNLHCRHCYHRPSECSKEIMDIAVYEKTVKMVHDTYDFARFIWHGGEPLIAQMGFFKKAIAIQKKYFGKEGCDNTIQTNGTLLNHRFIEFCKSNRINIGVSYEAGYERGMRPDMDVAYVDSMVDYMAKKQHMFLVNATVHGGNVDDVDAIYDKFREMKSAISYGPIINLGCAKDNPDLRLDADVYADKMIALYDRWLKDNTTNTPIIPFLPYVHTVVNGMPNISDCAHASCLSSWMCVYPNGDVYPCGKACPKEFLMGNIKDVSTIAELFESQGFRNILVGSIERRKKCAGCSVYRYCNGGCSIDAMADGNIKEPNGFACKVYKKLIAHIEESINEIMEAKPDMAEYNGFVRDSVLNKLLNPNIYDETSFQ